MAEKRRRCGDLLFYLIDLRVVIGLLRSRKAVGVVQDMLSHYHVMHVLERVSGMLTDVTSRILLFFYERRGNSMR
jgi:hypothetical protein